MNDSPQKSIIEGDPFVLLDDSQWRFVTAMVANPSYSKAEGARAIGLEPNTVYKWPEHVDAALEQARIDAFMAARSALTQALLKAISVKLKGLDSDDEGMRQKVATEVIEWQMGKPSQRVQAELTTPPDNALVINLMSTVPAGGETED